MSDLLCYPGLNDQNQFLCLQGINKHNTLAVTQLMTLSQSAFAAFQELTLFLNCIATNPHILKCHELLKNQKMSQSSDMCLEQQGQAIQKRQS